jgi:hypothetical protein
METCFMGEDNASEEGDAARLEGTEASPPAGRGDERGSEDVRSGTSEAAQVEGAPFPPFRPRRLGQDGDVVPRVPASPEATPPDAEDRPETENHGED